MSLGRLRSALHGLGIRTQLVLFFVIVFGVVFAAFSTVMYHHIARVHRDEFDRALHNYVVDVSHSIGQQLLSGMTPPQEALTVSEMILPFSLGSMLLQVADREGNVVMRSPNLGDRVLPMSWLNDRTLLADDGTFRDVRLTSDGKMKTGRYRMVSHALGKRQYVIQAAVPMILLDRQQEEVLLFLAIAVPLLLLIAGIVGHSFSGRALAPVAAIIQKANEIEVHQLSERIPIPRRRDEIQKLIQTLNSLLNRLETAFRSQEAFVADASHQLKSPLSILKGELTLLRQSTRLDGETRETLSLIEHELDYLIQIVQDLLLLATADSQTIQRASHRIRLDERVMDCITRFSKSAAEKQVVLAVNFHPDSFAQSNFEVDGDPELVRSMVENLVENAIKYSPLGGSVFLDLRDREGVLALHVRDEGRGVPTEAIPHIFDRFFRAEPTRNRADGSGLGLSIVQKVAALHGGNVRVENCSDGGALFILELPRAPEASESLVVPRRDESRVGTS